MAQVRINLSLAVHHEVRADDSLVKEIKRYRLFSLMAIRLLMRKSVDISLQLHILIQHQLIVLL